MTADAAPAPRGPKARGMLPFLVRRLAASALLLWALLSAVFFIVRLAPGDPLDRYADADLDAAGRAALRHSLGLDRPLGEQYARWLAGAARGDFGHSLRQRRPVAAILADAVPATLRLTLAAYLLHLGLAVAVGVRLAARRGRGSERAASVGGLVLASLPAFWLGQLLVLVFARLLGWLPASGLASPEAAWWPWPQRLLDAARHLLLPLCVLGVAPAFGTARFVRSGVAEALAQDYVLAARARGLPERVVLWKHALRNGLLPVVTLAGLSLPLLLGGAVVTEVVFAWPGMGRVAVDAIFGRDYPVIMATTALAATLTVAGNLLADLLYGVVDPRVRVGGGAAP